MSSELLSTDHRPYEESTRVNTTEGLLVPEDRRAAAEDRTVTDEGDVCGVFSVVRWRCNRQRVPAAGKFSPIQPLLRPHTPPDRSSVVSSAARDMAEGAVAA